MGWHDDVFFGIHYDLHATEEDTELGAGLTEEHLEAMFKETNPDWVQCDCKGHPGWTSWPTKTGYASPGVIKDSLRIHSDVCKKLGIKLGMHYSGVIDKKAAAERPEWYQIHGDGSPDVNRGATCRQSRYRREFMIPQLLELIETYGVDGFWVDGENWACQPCYCERCQSGFKNRTGISPAPMDATEKGWALWLEYQRDLFLEHVTDYADAVHGADPECQVCSNWMYTMRMPGPIKAPVDYLSGDYTWDWGAERAAVEARMLDNRSLSWDLMVWGFSRPAKGQEGEGLWQHKDSLHLCQEVSEVVALGGAVMVYGKPERNGRLIPWHNKVIADVGDFCRERREFCFKSESASEAAVLHLESTFVTRNDPLYNFGTAMEPIEGALHGLLENHISADILINETLVEKMSRYKLIVVPDQCVIDNATRGRLKTYMEEGGVCFFSGAFMAERYPDLCGCLGSRGSYGNATLGAGGMGTVVQGPWAIPVLREGTETVKYLLSSQNPEERTQTPAITYVPLGQGGALTAHGPLFRGYFLRHYPVLRSVIEEVIASRGIPWTVQAKGSRALEIIQRRQKGKLSINLINKGAAETLSPHRVVVEELPPLKDVELSIRMDEKPISVKLQPGDRDLPLAFEKGRLRVSVAEVAIHDIVVIQ